MVEDTICLDPGQARLDGQAEPDEVPAIPIPLNDVDAYLFGWEAAREGVDARLVIKTAALRWPLTPFDGWCEAVANATLGYWAALAGGGES
jgi:hypothetical protein